VSLLVISGLKLGDLREEGIVEIINLFIKIYWEVRNNKLISDIGFLMFLNPMDSSFYYVHPTGEVRWFP